MNDETWSNLAHCDKNLLLLSDKRNCEQFSKYLNVHLTFLNYQLFFKTVDKLLHEESECVIYCQIFYLPNQTNACQMRTCVLLVWGHSMLLHVPWSWIIRDCKGLKLFFLLQNMVRKLIQTTIMKQTLKYQHNPGMTRFSHHFTE